MALYATRWKASFQPVRLCGGASADWAAAYTLWTVRRKSHAVESNRTADSPTAVNLALSPRTLSSFPPAFPSPLQEALDLHRALKDL